MRIPAARLLATALAAAAAACAPATAPEHLAAARAQLQAGQREAAIVELKGALQSDPSAAEARFLLGSTLLEQGQAAAALIELERAAALGQPETAVSPPAARAMLALGQYRQVVARYQGAALPEDTAAADLQTSVAAAYAAQGLHDQATTAVGQALHRLPTYPPARLLQVRLLAAAGDLGAGSGLLRGLLDSQPQNADAWQLQGDLLAHQGASAPAAAQAYQRSLALRADGVPAHAGLVAALLRSGDVAGARLQADRMQAAQPNDPLTAFAQAQVSFAEGDAAKAHGLAVVALRALPEHPRLLQFLGMTELQWGAPLAAEPPLLKSLQRAPELALTRHLLATVYLATGQPGKLEAVLAPLLQQADPEALRQLAQARLQAGKPAAAQALLLGAQPGDVGSTEASRLGVEGLIAARKFDAAGAALASLDAAHRDQPETVYLRGQLQLAQHHSAAAPQRAQPLSRPCCWPRHAGLRPWRWRRWTRRPGRPHLPRPGWKQCGCVGRATQHRCWHWLRCWNAKQTATPAAKSASVPCWPTPCVTTPQIRRCASPPPTTWCARASPRRLKSCSRTAQPR